MAPRPISFFKPVPSKTVRDVNFALLCLHPLGSAAPLTSCLLPGKPVVLMSLGRWQLLWAILSLVLSPLLTRLQSQKKSTALPFISSYLQLERVSFLKPLGTCRPNGKFFFFFSLKKIMMESRI